MVQGQGQRGCPANFRWCNEHVSLMAVLVGHCTVSWSGCICGICRVSNTCQGCVAEPVSLLVDCCPPACSAVFPNSLRHCWQLEAKHMPDHWFHDFIQLSLWRHWQCAGYHRLSECPVFPAVDWYTLSTGTQHAVVMICLAMCY